MAKELSPKQIQDAVAHLKKGGVVLLPTETAYGLAADARNTRAVNLVHRIKGRSKEKTSPLVAADETMAMRYVKLSPQLKSLATKHWPGALTIVAPVKKGTRLSSSVVRKGTIAVRVSSSALAHLLSKGLGGPITSTSANKAGEATCYSVRTFLKQIPNADVLILDLGSIPRRRPSTIVGEEKGELVVHRKGPIRV